VRTPLQHRRETFELRRAAAGESSALAELYVASRLANVPAIPPPVHTLEETREWMRDTVFAQWEVWVAVDEDDRPVALMSLNGAHVEQLYVQPGFTGAHLGARLLELAQSGHRELDLWAFQSNRRAIRFYERHGFRPVRRTDGENEEHAPDVLLSWKR
jgi:GNAT superfamily N-acetyltransferase